MSFSEPSDPVTMRVRNVLSLCLTSLLATCALAETRSGPVTVPMTILDHFPVITARVEGQDVPLMWIHKEERSNQQGVN